MVNFPTPVNNTRLGFHYFPDAAHYRESDLHTWLPELQALGASWLVLLSPTSRAIPEAFLSGLISAGIEPIVHFPFNQSVAPNTNELRLLFEQYARWGVHYVVLFDRPNKRSAWPASSWSKNDLVERFLDRFLPAAETALGTGLLPALPPLEPGGDYWDLAFLRAVFQSLQRRGKSILLERLVLSAHATSGQRALNWGSGGPERWPNSRPYFTPPGSEDQRGFRIFDWYLAIAQAVLEKPCPILLLGVGSHPEAGLSRNNNFDDNQGGVHGNYAGLDGYAQNSHSPNGHSSNGHKPNADTHIQRNLVIAGGLSGLSTPPASTERLDPIPDQVLAGNFWLLAAEGASHYQSQAWFSAAGKPAQVAQVFNQWTASFAAAPALPKRAAASGYRPRPIAHYLLLPAFEWGVSDWHLNAVRPFVKKYRPVVGFSLSEAACADRVTVIGGPEHFSEDALQSLRAGGSFVERIGGDGTSIATILLEK